MKKEEFLTQLRKALQENLNSNAVQENVEYYNQYITEEVSKGKKEDEVLQMLGDPWILARTVIDAYDGTDRETVYESEGNSYSSSSAGWNPYQKGSPEKSGANGWPWWRKLLLILFVIMVLLLIGAVISGVIRLMAPIIFPLLIVILVVRILGGRRQ